MPTVPLKKLAEWSPFQSTVWDRMGKPLTPEEILAAILEGRLRGKPVGLKATRKDHIERVAFLVVNKDSTPISLDVGVPSLGYVPRWPILDGHHRLAAAIYRNDETIEADIDGEVDYAEQLFGVTLPRTVGDLVLDAVRRHPGKTSRELFAHSDCKRRSSVSNNLSKFERTGKVKSEGTPKRYTLC